MSKNLPLGDRLPRYGGGGACARGGAVARRAGGREPRLCPKPSCLREALSPTACGRSPLPEGAKEFFDNLPAPFRGGMKAVTHIKKIFIYTKETTIMQKKFKIEVDCANCAAKIETAIKELPGVKNASVSFMAQKLLLEADDDKFDAVLKDAVKVAKKVEPDFEIEL